MFLQLHNLAILAAILIAPLTTAEATFDASTPIASLVASGKAARAQGQNQDAVSFFDEAIVRNPSDYLTFFHRGATFLSMGKHHQAKNDFDNALKLRPDFEGALLQRARIHARGADWELAKTDYRKVGIKAEADLASLEEAEGAAYLAFESEKKQDWETCVNQAGVAIMIAGTSLSLRQLRVRCRFEKAEIQEALSDLQHVLHISPGSIEPHMQISSMSFYSLDDTEKGVGQMKKCLHSDPESKPCKLLFREEKQLVKSIEKVHKLMDAKQYASAAKLLVSSNPEETGLIEDIKTKSDARRRDGYIHEKASDQLYTTHVEKACEAYFNIKSKKTEQYCQLALQLNPESLYGQLHKAQIQVNKEDFDAAIGTLNTAKELHGETRIIQEKLQEAHTLLKRSKQKDYYKVLGVSRDADDRTIKRAYRQLSKQHHPDKAMARGVNKEEAEKKMASINEAFEVLSDPELRQRFDHGDDPNDPQSGRGGPFQQGGNPFAGFGGQQFVFQQGFGGQGGKRQFHFQGGPGQGFPFGM